MRSLVFLGPMEKRVTGFKLHNMSSNGFRRLREIVPFRIDPFFRFPRLQQSA
jgi:hypothetical protein